MRKKPWYEVPLSEKEKETLETLEGMDTFLYALTLLIAAPLVVGMLKVLWYSL